MPARLACVTSETKGHILIAKVSMSYRPDSIYTFHAAFCLLDLIKLNIVPNWEGEGASCTVYEV